MDTRERLIESAQALLWERGYVGMSPKAIQEKAAAGQGSMYHHFENKAALASAAIARSAEQLYASAQQEFTQPCSALDRIIAYLHREREALRGCRVGRLTQDPEIIADPQLRQPVQEMFAKLTQELAALIVEGQSAGEFRAELNPEDTASTILAVLQGAYVLARAANSAEPFHRAIAGAISLLQQQGSVKRAPRK
ncbi:TetR family transcriptional regulator [Dyella monticola]|uniref:TetR family transcriptional regulator n=1 Tax=Dyella monticola TaxID=1927958 RepID=A0A370X1L6_9GAMM|nr:TetR family transcriptional regulator [Dyella monticola]RDS82288.1 TetR family transcriptional regulator [Dyella monticola]